MMNIAKIIDLIADPIFIKDRQHRWVLLNDAFCGFMARSREELIGKSDHDFFPKTEADVFWQKDEEVFKTGRENVNEEFFTDGNGVRRVIITKKTRYTDQQGVFFIVGIIRDISELRRTADELKEAYDRMLLFQDRMVQAEKMASLGQLVAGIAHEINNPVAYILSNLYTLEEYERRIDAFIKSLPAEIFTQKANADLKTFTILEDTPLLIQETLQGAERIRKIIRDLRVFAHPDEGKMEPGDLHLCLEQAMAILASELKYKVTLIKEYGQIPPVCFQEQSFLQVFVNLLLNAAQAIATAGTITVRTYPDGNEVVIEVRDTGCGIAPEDLPRVFDPFFTTKPVGQGTGLGLSFVHGIIKKHHGKVSVTSQSGEGTVVTLRLLRDGPVAG